MPARILLVDADPATLSWLRTKLEAEGYAIDTTDRGDLALQKIGSTSPDLVVLDLVLPDMDGLDLIRRARQDPRSSNIGLIVLSASAQPNDIVASLNTGADQYILKRPGADIELFAKIRAQLEQLQRNAEAAASKRGHIFSFCSAKGGSGTTSVCVNTAYALAKLAPGTEILIVDMVFPMGTVGLSLGFESHKTVARLSNEAKDKIDNTIVEEYVSQPLRWGFRVLLGANDPQEASSLDVSQVPPLFRMLKTMYDYILVDFGRTLSRISLPIMELSTGIVVIITPDITTVRATQPIVQHLESHDIPRERLILINNRTVGRVWTTTEDIEREVKLSLSATVPYEVEYMTMATNAAVPFMEKFPENSACMSFNSIARILVERGKQKTP